MGSSRAKGGQFIPDFVRPSSEESASLCRKLKLDSKGRISIPCEFRKNYGLEEGTGIELVFDLRKNFAILIFASEKNGQDGACSSTEDCGSSEPGASPGPGPGKTKEVGK